MVWQGRDRNEWATALGHVLAAEDSPAATRPLAFSLAERSVTTGILAAAGFASIDFAEVREPVFYGRDIDAAYEAIVALFLDRRAPTGARLARLRAMLETHLTTDGLLFDSRAWIVTARRET